MKYRGHLEDKEGNIYYPELEDTGWQILSLTEKFKAYHDIQSNTPSCRRIGKIVEIKGTVAPKSLITANSEAKICELPDGYRPSKDTFALCQGSGVNKWLITVAITGDVFISRYGISSATDIPTSAWLPFNLTFFID